VDVFIELLCGTLFGLNTAAVDDTPFLDRLKDDDVDVDVDVDDDDEMEVEVCDEDEIVDS